MSYTTPCHTQHVGLRWTMCITCSAWRTWEVCFPSYVVSKKNSLMFKPEFGRFLFSSYRKGFWSLNSHHWHQGPVSWRPTTVKWRQSSQSNRHSTIGTQQTKYHEALLSSANDEVMCDCTFADDSNASWYSVCRVLIVELRLACEDSHHLMVISLHDTSPRMLIVKFVTVMSIRNFCQLITLSSALMSMAECYKVCRR